MSITDLPFPLQGTIPSMHKTGEMIRLPAKTSAKDAYGLYDYGWSSGHTTPYLWTKVGTVPIDENGALIGNGANYLTAATGTDLYMSTGMVFQIKVKGAGDAQGIYLFASEDDGGSLFTDLLYDDSNNRFSFRTNGVYKYFAYSSATMNDGNYHTVTFRWDTTTYGEVWVDDVALTPSGDAGTGAPSFYSGISIGSTYNDAGSSGAYYVKDILLLKNVTTVPTTPYYLPQDLFQYNPHEVLNLPLNGHITDLSYGTAKAAPETAHVIDQSGGAVVSADGLTFNGSQYATIANSQDQNLADGDFYIREKVYFNSVAAAGFIGNGYNAGWLTYYDAGALYFYYKPTISTYTSGSVSWTPSTSTWYTLEFIRSGSTLTFKVNGIVLGTHNIGATIIAHPANALYLGRDAVSTDKLNGIIKDILILKGTATAPASTYQYALQDLRFAKDETEVAYTAPLRGLNPISGQYDVWIKEDLSSTSDNELTAYIGNASAEAPSVGVTWPTAWKRNFFGSGFRNDLINNTMLTLVGSPTFSKDGMAVSSGNAAYEADSADWIASSGSILIAYKPTNGSAASQTLLNQRVDGNNALIAVLSGTDLQANEWIGGIEQWTAQATLSWGNGVLDMMQVIGDEDRVDLYFNGVSVGNDQSVGSFLADLAAPINYGRNGAGTNYAAGTILMVLYIQNSKLTADQALLMDAAVTTPATFQTIGTLENNVA